MSTSLIRCPWVPKDDSLYMRYHDEEWGVPVHDDTKHYEFLVLESAQAGLSWRTILHKRSGYREAFCDFDYRKVARFGASDVQRLLGNPGIIRNKAKIEAAIANARMVNEIQNKYGSLSEFLWQFVDNKPIINHWQSSKDCPAYTPLSEQITKALKKEGSRFIGPTTMYAHMQATGLVNDHSKDCFRHPDHQ